MVTLVRCRSRPDSSKVLALFWSLGVAYKGQHLGVKMVRMISWLERGMVSHQHQKLGFWAADN
jgi:hypothetical protein